LPNDFEDRMLNLVKQEPLTESPQADFATFWLLYPRRVAKRDAEKAWSKMTAAERYDAIVALVDWSRIWRARGEIEFIPYPATWLNGARWEDELPVNNAPTHASHVPAKPHLAVERGEMPAGVREAIARLKR
jgi:hypothetical protein